MKSEDMGVCSPLSKKDFKNLFNETKETLAQDVKSANNNRVFGTVDLWNIERKRRGSSSLLRRLQ